jgi:tetratricopeptide (TPR) repeat protein
MIGWLHTQLGDNAQAVASCRQSLALARELDDAIGRGGTLSTLGCAYLRLGQYDRAVTCYEQAVALGRQAGARASVADSLAGLGDTYDAAGRPEAARNAWEQALDILDDLDDPGGDAVRVKLPKLGAG